MGPKYDFGIRPWAVCLCFMLCDIWLDTLLLMLLLRIARCMTEYLFGLASQLGFLTGVLGRTVGTLDKFSVGGHRP
jgi:hypothetical protein